MNVTGIITEYNPFHNGHLYHIKKSREITNADAIICVMSGNFVQRGLPAIFDKWKRTEMALQNGVDLVLELPSVYSLASAEFFALGSVSLLHNIGIVNNLCFGSEAGNVDILLEIAKILILEPEEYKFFLKKYLNEGFSFPSSRNKALKDFFNTHKTINTMEDLDNVLSSSNNILGIEYCKNLIKLKSNVNPLTIKRIGSNYNDELLESSFSSATAIRKYMNENKSLEDLKSFVPENVYEIFSSLHNENYGLISPDSMLPYLKYKCLTENDTLQLLPDISEGLHNKVKHSILNSSNFDETVLNIKSKRYTYTRISRLLSQYFLGFENFNTGILRNSSCPYARVLGFNKTGTLLLKNMKTTSTIPVITKLPKILHPTLQLDVQSTNTYSILNKNIQINCDYLKSPITCL